MDMDRLVLHTIHTDDGNTELYFGRAYDDWIVTPEGSLLFHRDGGFTYKMTTDDDVPVVIHVEANRVRVSEAEDQPPFYADEQRGALVLFDSNDARAIATEKERER